MMKFISGSYFVTWTDTYGNLDHTPYSRLVFEKCGTKDTICIPHLIENIVPEGKKTTVFIDEMVAMQTKGEIERLKSYGLSVEIINTPKNSYEKYNKYINTGIDDLLTANENITLIKQIKDLGNNEILMSFSGIGEDVLLITLHLENEEYDRFNKIDIYDKSMFSSYQTIKSIIVLNNGSYVISLPYKESVTKLYDHNRERYVPWKQQ